MAKNKHNPVADAVAEIAAIDAEAKLRRHQQRANDAEGKFKALLEKCERLQAELDAVSQIQDISTFDIPDYPITKSECTAVALASDWHSEERVDPKTVNHLNEFTLAIAKKRIDLFFTNVARLVIGKQKATKIKVLVLALLGDFISGYIHEELIEVAQLPPIEATISVMNHIASGIEYLLKTTDVDLVLPCHSGNHGRTTKRVHQATERGNSLEYFMYKVLADHFAKNKRVTFAIAAGYHSFTDIHGFKIRFHHGHNIRYAGGVGGITIPVNKAIAQWNKSGSVDADCFGHFHQMRFGGNYICNGSLIGHNAFGVSIKADFERPKQAFFLVNHKRREITDFCPIWLD